MKKENRNKNIVIVTGGTGGHIYPAITLGEYLSKKYLNVCFITLPASDLRHNSLLPALGCT